MSFPSRHHSSKTVYQNTSNSSHGRYNDSPDYPRPLATIRENQQRDTSRGSSTSHALNDCPRDYHSHGTSRKVTVTTYSVHTSSESTTSFYDRREYTAHDSHRSSSAYIASPRTERSSSSVLPNGKDRRHISDKSHRGSAWQPKDHSRMPEASSQRRVYEDSSQRRVPGASSLRLSTEYTYSDRPGRGSSRTDAHRDAGYSHAKPSELKEPESTFPDGRFKESKSHKKHTSTTNNVSSQPRLGSGSSRRQERTSSNRSESRRGETASEAEEKLPDHYATLKIGALATDEEIKSAAKRRRVEVHPDKLNTTGMSDSQRAKIDVAAAKVGQAADVLQDPELKRKYDRKLFASKGWTWHGK